MSPQHDSDGRSEHDRSAQGADALPSARARTAGGSLPPGGGGGRGVGAKGPILGVLRPFNPISWFHPKGIKRVLARLEPRLPNVAGCLFLTFTINPLLYADPIQAFENSRQLLRRIFYKLRRGVKWEGKTYKINEPYAVKVEFHKNEWAHFHVIFLTRRFLPADLITHLWGLGRTDVGRISNEKFRYLLKYVTKGGGIPEWVRQRNRLKVFQASKGFLKPVVKVTPAVQRPRSGRKRRASHENLGQRMDRYQKTALFQSGTSFSHVPLPAPFDEMHGAQILPAALDGRYLGGGHYQINDTNQLMEWIV
jgi:hypothetical protein